MDGLTCVLGFPSEIYVLCRLGYFELPCDASVTDGRCPESFKYENGIKSKTTTVANNTTAIDCISVALHTFLFLCIVLCLHEFCFMSCFV